MAAFGSGFNPSQDGLRPELRSSLRHGVRQTQKEALANAQKEFARTEAENKRISLRSQSPDMETPRLAGGGRGVPLGEIWNVCVRTAKTTE
jgi:hypothetical protein